MAKRSGNSLSTAYYAAQRSKERERTAKRTEAAPKIYQVLKTGKLGKNPVDQTYHTWNTIEEAEKHAERMEGMNPGHAYVVLDPATGSATPPTAHKLNRPQKGKRMASKGTVTREAGKVRDILSGIYKLVPYPPDNHAEYLERIEGRVAQAQEMAKKTTDPAKLEFYADKMKFFAKQAMTARDAIVTPGASLRIVSGSSAPVHVPDDPNEVLRKEQEQETLLAGDSSDLEASAK